MGAERRRTVAPLRVLVAPAIALLLAALAWWWTHPPDPVRDMRSRRRPLAVLRRLPLPAAAPGLERWLMVSTPHDTVSGLWRPPRASRFPWVIVLLGGIGTDDRAALLVPDSLPAGVLAVSWPWKGPRRMGRLRFLASVPGMREALLRSPDAIARGVEAVRRACPGSRVAIVGVSLGVPPTVAALPLARPDALVLVDGAADLPRLLRWEIVRELGERGGTRALALPAGALAARLLSSLEPARYGATAGATPVLLVDAEREERYPPGAVARLRATFPGAARRRHPGGHIRPTDRPDVAAIAGIVWSWLDGLGGAAGTR